MISEVDDFIEKASRWKQEFSDLRRICLDCNLQETYKWKTPVYTYKGKNLILLGGFKDHLVISFLNGSLLTDSENILQSPGENSKSARVIRFTCVDEIQALESSIRAYIFEAKALRDSGRKVELSENKKLEFPAELKEYFLKDPVLKKSFLALSVGKQRGYNIFFSAAKQSKTVYARIEKYKERIIDGYGIHDCVCGLSKRKPTCDGSHKELLES